MGYSGYISALANFEEVDLAVDVDYRFYLLVVNTQMSGGPFSIYGLHRQINSHRHIAYKNVHQKVMRLLACKLIELVPDQHLRGIRNIHGAKYYKLSHNGWFNLIINRDIALRQVIYDAFTRQYNGKNIICETFLVPFFELKTLENLKPYSQFIVLLLENCCRSTYDLIKPLKGPVETLTLEDGKNVEYDFKDFIQSNAITQEFDRIVKAHLVSFAFDFMYSVQAGIFSREVLQILAGDAKFVVLLKKVEHEFQTGYLAFMNSTEK